MKYHQSKSFYNKSLSPREIYLNLPQYNIKADPMVHDAFTPNKAIYFEPIVNKLKQMPFKKVEITSRNKRQGKVFNKINQFYSELNSRMNVTKVNEKHIKETKGLYEKKPILQRENNDSSAINSRDPDSLVTYLTKEYHKRNMRLPHINSRDKHNIFKQNPLLESGTSLENYYLLHKEQSVADNANKYLNNIENNLFGRFLPRQYSFNQKMLKEQSRTKEDGRKCLNLKKEIRFNKKEINALSQTIDDLDVIDEFYKTKNRLIDLKEPKPSKEGYKTFILNYKNKNKPKRKCKKNIFKNTDITNKAKTFTNSKSIDLRAKMKKILFKIADISNNCTIEHADNKTPLEQLYFDCSHEFKEASRMNISHINDYIENTYKPNSTSAQGLVSQFSSLQKTLTLRNYVRETYDIQRSIGLKMDLLPNQLELLEKSNSLDQTIKKSQSQLLKVLHKGAMPN